MKLWGFWRKCSEETPDSDEDTLELWKLDISLHKAEEKLERDKEILPQLSKAVASARRVKYRVDSFTTAMYDGMRGAGNHG